jgi:hypothetical protein
VAWRMSHACLLVTARGVLGYGQAVTEGESLEIHEDELPYVGDNSGV